jgi:hypothetical protein
MFIYIAISGVYDIIYYFRRFGPNFDKNSGDYLENRKSGHIGC